MKSSLILKFAAACVLSTGLASATVITFDGVAGITSGYGGIATWSNLIQLNGDTYGLSGYQNGVVSHPDVAFNGGGSDAYIANPTAFDLNSGYFTAAWNNGLQLQIEGYQGATLVYNNTYTLNTTGPSFLDLQYLDVTKVTFHSFGGTSAGLGGGGEHFNMDNLTVNDNSSVPDSGSTLLLLGAGLTGLVAWRRKSARS